VPKKQFRIEDFLANLPLLRELGKDAVVRIARGVTEVMVPRGTILYRPGDPSEGFHVVVHGHIKVALPTPRGGEKVIDLIGPGQSFGEATMFLDKTHITTAEALVDSRLVLVAKAVVVAEIERNSRLARRVIAVLSRRVHQLLAEVEALSLHSGTQRVIGYLLSQVPQNAGGKAVAISLPAKKSIIASRLDLTHEHFSRILHNLAAEGLVEVGGRKISIRDTRRLRAFEA
jgi:CRP/FNR family transcriptional regulator, dissimilatory nitrate respiration regulator